MQTTRLWLGLASAHEGRVFTRLCQSLGYSAGVRAGNDMAFVDAPFDIGVAIIRTWVRARALNAAHNQG